jgi:hypothetical protein
MTVHHRVAISRQNSNDEAALDRLVERALAESDLSDPPSPSDQSWGDPEAFLIQAAAFLMPRPDRDDLIERLRARITYEPAAAGPKPGEAETEAE